MVFAPSFIRTTSLFPQDSFSFVRILGILCHIGWLIISILEILSKSAFWFQCRTFRPFLKTMYHQKSLKNYSLIKKKAPNLIKKNRQHIYVIINILSRLFFFLHAAFCSAHYWRYPVKIVSRYLHYSICLILESPICN